MSRGFTPYLTFLFIDSHRAIGEGRPYPWEEAPQTPHTSVNRDGGIPIIPHGASAVSPKHGTLLGERVVGSTIFSRIHTKHPQLPENPYVPYELLSDVFCQYGGLFSKEKNREEKPT
jgi:hypothetical protein